MTTNEFNAKVATYWPTSGGYDPAKRSPMCELYETSLAMVIVMAATPNGDPEQRLGTDESTSAALTNLANHLHNHRGLNFNQLNECDWDDVEFGVYNAADMALTRGADPYELAASTTAFAALLDESGIDCLRDLAPNNSRATPHADNQS